MSKAGIVEARLSQKAAEPSKQGATSGHLKYKDSDLIIWAKDFTSRADAKRADSKKMAVIYARRLQDKSFAHAPPSNKKQSDAYHLKRVEKCKTVKEAKQKCRNSYEIICRRGLRQHPRIAHLARAVRRPYSLEELQMAINDCTTLKELKQKYPNELWAIYRRKNSQQLLSGLGRSGGNYRRVVYRATVISTGAVYFGLTYNLDIRARDHLKGTEQLKNYSEEEVVFDIVSDGYIDASNARDLEIELIEKARQNPNVHCLNRHSGGSLGGAAEKHSLEAIEDSMLGFKELARWRESNESAYNRLMQLQRRGEVVAYEIFEKLGLSRQLAEHSESSVMIAVEQCTYYQDFHQRFPAEYNASGRLGLRQNIKGLLPSRPIKRKWTKETIVESAHQLLIRRPEATFRDWTMSFGSAAVAAYSLGCVDELRRLVGWPAPPRHTDDSVRKLALTFDTFTDFREECGGAYNAGSNELIEELKSMLPAREREPKYKFDLVLSTTFGFETEAEWRKDYDLHARWAVERGKIGAVREFANWSVPTRYTRELVEAIASACSSGTEFIELHGGAYNHARNNSYLAAIYEANPQWREKGPKPKSCAKHTRDSILAAARDVRCMKDFRAKFSGMKRAVKRLGLEDDLYRLWNYTPKTSWTVEKCFAVAAECGSKKAAQLAYPGLKKAAIKRGIWNQLWH